MDNHSQKDTSKMNEEHGHHAHAGHQEQTEHAMHEMHNQHEDHGNHSAHERQAQPMKHEQHAAHSEHATHGTDHTGHERMFRTRFWWSLLLSIPVLLYSEMLQGWLGFAVPIIPGSEWIPFVFSLAIFGYGGVPFLQMAVPAIRDRKPRRMMPISPALSVAF